MGLTVLIPLQASLAYPSSMNAIASGYCPWDETSIFINDGSNQILLSHEEFIDRQGTEGMYTFSFVFVLIDVLAVDKFCWELIMGYGVTDSADIGSKGVARTSKCSSSGIGSSSRTLPSSEIPNQGIQAPVRHGNPLLRPWFVTTFVFDLTYAYYYFPGIPDFAEVYSFIGGVFDPDTQGHAQKLKEMDPINFETVSWMEL